MVKGKRILSLLAFMVVVASGNTLGAMERQELSQVARELRFLGQEIYEKSDVVKFIICFEKSKINDQYRNVFKNHLTKLNNKYDELNKLVSGDIRSCINPNNNYTVNEKLEFYKKRIDKLSQYLKEMDVILEERNNNQDQI